MLQARTASWRMVTYRRTGPEARARALVCVCDARMESNLLFLYEVYCFYFFFGRTTARGQRWGRERVSECERKATEESRDE